MDNIRLVQQRLWSNGHRTKRIPAGLGFDILVDGNVRVRVDKRQEVPDYDILAIVKKEIDGKKRIFYEKEGEYSKSFKALAKGGGREKRK